MVKEEVIYNWLGSIRQIVYAFFTTTGKPINQDRLFQNSTPEQCWTNIENFIDSLMRLPLWVNKDLSASVFGGKQNYDYWHAIFQSGTSPLGHQVMPEGLDLMEMIKTSEEI